MQNKMISDYMQKFKNYELNDKKALLSDADKEINKNKQEMRYIFSGGDDLYDNRLRNTNADNNADMVATINDIRAQHEAQIPISERFFGDEQKNYQKGQDALKKIARELKAQGKGTLVNADGVVYYKNPKGEYVDLNEGLLKDVWRGVKANKAAIAGGITGAVLAPMTGGASILSSMTGAAVGSGLGAGVDYVGNAGDTKDNIDLSTMGKLMLEEAGLSALGDSVVYGAIKGGKALYDGGRNFVNKSRTLKDSFGNEIDNVGLMQTMKNFVDNTPIIGDITSANHAPAMGEIKRSIDNAEKMLTPDELADKQAYMRDNKIELEDINTLGIKAKAYADDYANRTSSQGLKDKIENVGEYIKEKSSGTLNPQITKEQEMALNNAFADPAELRVVRETISNDDLVRNRAVDVVNSQTQKRLKEAGIDENFRLNSESFKKLTQKDTATAKQILESYVKAQKSEYETVKDAFSQIAGDKPLWINKQGLDNTIDTIVANYAKVEDRDKMRLTLNQMAQDGFNINKAFDVRKFLNKAIRNSDYSGAQQARALKDVLDDSMFQSLGDDGVLRGLLQDQDTKYATMKNLKDTKLFNKNNDLLNDDFSFDSIGNLLNKNNSVWQKATQGLNGKQISEIEKAYIRNIIKDELIDLGMNKKGLNSANVANKLRDANFISNEARSLQKSFFDDEKFRPNTQGIIDAISTGLKTQNSNTSSMATSLGGKATIAFVNNSFKRLAKHIPIIGKQAGKQHLYAEAFLKAKTGDDTIKNIINNVEIPLQEKIDFLSYANNDRIKILIDDFIKVKEAGIKELAAEPNKPNFTLLGSTQGANNTQFNFKQDVKEKAKISSKEIMTNLDILQNKHPNIFKTRGDVARLIMAIKDEPTHFFDGSNKANIILAKQLNDKLGMIGVQKDGEDLNLIIHALKSSNENELKRLVKKQMDRASLPITLKNETGTGAKAHSSANNAIISQSGLKGKNFTMKESGKSALLNQHSDTMPDGASKLGRNDRLDSSINGVMPQSSKKLQANPHLGSGLFAGALNSRDENGNFSPENFIKGFAYGLMGSKVGATALHKLSPKTYNAILGLGEKMPTMAKSNPALLGKIYKNAKDSSINTFAGEKALNAKANKLIVAKAMAANNTDEVAIWQKTGWFRDEVDGKWKFEINPKGGTIISQNGGKLGEILKDDELFAAYPQLKKINVVKLGDMPDSTMMSVKDATQKEKRGIYNVTHNDKIATYIKQDLQSIENALRYAKGDKSKGAEHIKIRHLPDSSKDGYVSQDELLNLGENIRKYIAKYGEPFVDDKGGRVYEWADKDGVRFRAVIGKAKREQDDPTITSTLKSADEATKKGLRPNSSLYSSDEIITFYSDRNLKKLMKFKNPKVAYDENLKAWHKDSHAITKNADGSPKVFYHGSREAKDLQIFKKQPDGSGYGFWFSTSKKEAEEYLGRGDMIQSYLNIKKPFEVEKINDYESLKNIFGLSQKAFKEFIAERAKWRSAMSELKKRGYRVADSDYAGFYLYDKNDNFVKNSLQGTALGEGTLRQMGLDDLAHFLDGKYYDNYITGEVDVLMAIMNKNDYSDKKGFLQNKLKKAGYDGIKINDNVFVAFNSNQIKHVKNNGNFSDSPNIYQSVELEKNFLNKQTDKLKLSELEKEATMLPKAMREKEFKAQFKINGKNEATIKTPIGDVKLENVDKTWKHFVQNTYLEDRSGITGAFVDTLKSPLFVVRQKYQQTSTALNQANRSQRLVSPSSQMQDTKTASGKFKTDEILTQDSLVFYKPYKTDDGVTHLASFAVDSNGNLIHKTFYSLDENLGKLKQLIKSPDSDVVYYKNTQSSAAQSPIEHYNTKGYYDPAKNEIVLSDMGDKSTLYHEIQHAVQEIEGFAKGGKIDNSKYAKLGGEAEARNVQNRLNLSSNNLKHPLHTLDVARNERIAKDEIDTSDFSDLEKLLSDISPAAKKIFRINKDLERIEKVKENLFKKQ